MSRGRKSLPRNRRFDCGSRASTFVGRLKSKNKEVPYTRDQFAEWLYQQGFPFITCRYCKKTTDAPHEVCIDHILPEVKGGQNDYANLQLICADCNKRKGCHTHINLILWARTVYLEHKDEIESELNERERSKELLINFHDKDTHG